MLQTEAVGSRETMGNVVKKIMGKAGFDGHFTNHSLRQSYTTKLYDNGVLKKCNSRNYW